MRAGCSAISRRLSGQSVHPANNFGLPPARGIPDFDGLREAVQTHGCVNPRAADLQQLLDVFHFEQTIIRLSVVVIHRSPHQGHFCPPSHRGAWLNQQFFCCLDKALFVDFLLKTTNVERKLKFLHFQNIRRQIGRFM